MAPRRRAVAACAVLARSAWPGWRRAAHACALALGRRRLAVDDKLGAVDLMLDLPRWLLLRLRPLPGAAAAGTRWLAVPADEAGPAWRALRAALYSRAAHALPTASRMPVRPPD